MVILKDDKLDKVEYDFLSKILHNLPGEAAFLSLVKGFFLCVAEEPPLLQLCAFPQVFLPLNVNKSG